MASETGIIPDLYFPEDDLELQTSSVEGKEVGSQGGEVERKKPVDLTLEGFIPIHKLTLEDLPEPIRTEQHLQCILDVSKNVVKVNNNGLSDKRPDDDQFKQNKQKSLCGSGYLINGMSRSQMVTTNRHVLYNEEEMQKSTFDVFFDYDFRDPNDKKKLFKRSVRQNGQIFVGKFSEFDVAHVGYIVKDEMIAHIRENCCENDITVRYPKLVEHPNVAGDPNTPPVVCLISHPLGQPKHVSFGELLDYNMHSRTVHHSAPSKPGSSGGSVLVFSRNLHHAIHVGKEKGKGYARVDTMEASPRDMLDSADRIPIRTIPTTKTPAEEVIQKARAALESSYLIALVPVFGAFLLHTQEPCAAARDTSTLKPCKTSLEVPLDLKQSVRELIQSLTQVAPSFTLCPSSKSGDASDLISVLETQGPCYCQSIVKMMEKGVKLEDGTVTECFLSPNTAAAKMSSDGDVTWPWLNRNNSDVRNDDAEEECILEKCLKYCDGDIIAVILLLMITKANACFTDLYVQRCDASSTATHCKCEHQRGKGSMRTMRVHSCKRRAKKWPDERQDSSPQEKMKNLTSSRAETEGDKLRFVEDILTFLDYILHLSPLSLSELPENNVDVLYSRCVALSEHARQHEVQVHSDTERARGDNGGNWCQCGRPGAFEFRLGCHGVVRQTLAHVVGGYDAFKTKVCEAGNTAPILRLIKNSEVQGKGDYFMGVVSCFISEQHHLDPSQKSPADSSGECSTNSESDDSEEYFHRLLHDAFPDSRQASMLFLASTEAYMYNFCLLARHIGKHHSPKYYAFPVSVFGRPGNWPGKVTPPEVQRTAWRLLQDAIIASGFPPAVLADLEKDADRREKLIDLYVDMKQLKKERQIHPRLFKKCLALSLRQRTNHMQLKDSFENGTHYFVWYAAFLVCPQIFDDRGSTFQRHLLSLCRSLAARATGQETSAHPKCICF